MRTREQMNKSKSWILTKVKVKRTKGSFMDGYLGISEEALMHPNIHSQT